MNITEMLGLQDERMESVSGNTGRPGSPSSHGWGSSTTRVGWTPGGERMNQRWPTVSCSAWPGWRLSTVPMTRMPRWYSRGSCSRRPCECAAGWGWPTIGSIRCWPSNCGSRSAGCRGDASTGWPRKSPVSCAKGCCWTEALSTHHRPRRLSTVSLGPIDPADDRLVEDDDPAVELAELLAWACAEDVITDEDRELLVSLIEAARSIQASV